MSMGNRLWIIGLDGASAPLLLRMVDEAPMPNLGRLLKQGASSVCLPPVPDSPDGNWATLATGAPPSVHGVPNPFNNPSSAEQLWDVAERWGKNALFVGGAWQAVQSRSAVRLDPAGGADGELFPAAVVEMGQGRHPRSAMPRFRAAEPWSSMDEGVDLEADILQARLEINSETRFGAVLGLWLGLSRDHDGGFDSLWVADDPSAENPARIRAAEWSEPLSAAVEFGGERLDAVFRVKLEELDPDGAYMRAYISPVRGMAGFAVPAELEPDLAAQAGPPPPGPGDFEDPDADPGTLAELWRLYFDWLGRAAVMLMRRTHRSVMFSRLTEPAQVNHFLLNPPPVHAEDAEFRLGRVRDFYAALDIFVGQIMEAGRGRDAISVVGGSGCRGARRWFSIRNFLIEQGYIKTETRGHAVKPVPAESRVRIWGEELWINSADRFPDGVVGPGEYEPLRDELIQLLRELKDPATGRRPVAAAVKREDGAVMGFWGAKRGDILVLLDPEYCHDGDRMETGAFEPDAESSPWAGVQGCCADETLLALMGPGIRRGYGRDTAESGPAKLEDAAPTWASVLGVPAPKRALGRRIEEFFE